MMGDCLHCGDCWFCVSLLQAEEEEDEIFTIDALVRTSGGILIFDLFFENGQRLTLKHAPGLSCITLCRPMR